VHDEYPCFEGGFIRVKLEVNMTRMKIPPLFVAFGPTDRALSSGAAELTAMTATHISCRNEMMQRTVSCAILLLKSW
jgi:hypothetical protein